MLLDFSFCSNFTKYNGDFLSVEMFSNVIIATGDRLVKVCAKRGILIVSLVD